MHRFAFGSLILLAVPVAAFSADDEYRTVENAIAAKQPSGPVASVPVALPGHLGLQLEANAQGQVVVEDVEADSPAASAGLRAGDVVARMDAKEIASADAFRNLLHSKSAGERLKLTVTRQGKLQDFAVVLGPASRPMSPVRPQPSILGIDVTAVPEGEGVKIESVLPGSAAEKAKLKVGETILKMDETPVSGPDRLRELLEKKKADDTVTLSLLLADKRVDYKVKLAEVERPGGRPGGGGGFRNGGWNTRYWTKPAFHLAIVLVEYPDVKHNEKIPPSAWADAMFSAGKYTKTATGQTAYGSMHDYYLEQSYGQLKVDGKAFDYLKMDKNRMDYNAGDRSVFLKEALDKLLAREGKDVLKDYDGFFFIYAGGRTNAARGSLYWPNKSNFNYNGKNWPYFICMECEGRQGNNMANISVFCHEFGHILGLPDLYARPESPGMEGVGQWCAMSNQVGQGRPQHFCAWSKEKLGWIKPTTIDANVPQKLILAPIEDSPKECFKILVKPDGSEYFLLENRKKKGFDTSVPGEGLLIWRVIGNRPVLEESHGIAGPSGPQRFLSSVPFPSDSNRAFTPYTTPSSRSQLGGGANVFITNIEKRPDGKISFHIGYEYE
jgi:M6 family metalloprotease-like protein